MQNQRDAGRGGRREGHNFEQHLVDSINSISWIDAVVASPTVGRNLYCDNPGLALLGHIIQDLGLTDIESVTAHCLGGLATDNSSTHLLDAAGAAITKSKCDVLLDIRAAGRFFQKGISVKSCNTARPTNAQLYLTTATAFVTMLRNNGIAVSSEAAEGLRMFCGDIGYRPSDLIDGKKGDFANPARYYWEQLPTVGRENLEQLFAIHQDAITRLLCESGYKNEHAVPEYLLHKTKKAVFSNTEFAEVAIYSIKELVLHSHQLRGFCLRPYGRKGVHKAPRFGIVQMQRMGNKQNPTQLQFNLQAGYFYKLQELAEQPSA